MPLYEHVFLARQDISTQQIDSLKETFQTIVSDNGGKCGKTEYWGLKPLSYKIKKNRKAHYVLMNIDAPHEAVAEMERQMGISTDILRFLTLRVEAHNDAPSLMMKKGDREDRRGSYRRDREGSPRDSKRSFDNDRSAPRDRGRARAAAGPRPDAETHVTEDNPQNGQKNGDQGAKT